MYVEALTDKHFRILAWTVAVVTGLLFFWNLGSLPFRDYDEATYAQVVKESLAGHRFLPLTLHGKEWVDKPPLYFWMAKATADSFGFSEGTARFPSALLGALSVFLTFLIARELSGKRSVALLSALILLTTPAFLEASRQLRLDVPVTFFLLLGCFAFLRGHVHPRWYLVIGIAGVLGFLSKSVVIGLLLPVILIISIVYKRWYWLRSGYFWGGFLLGTGLLLPWALFEIARDSAQFFNTYIVSHLLNRVSKEVVGGGVTVSTYLFLLFRFVEPWIFVFFVTTAWCVTRLIRSWKETFTSHREEIVSVAIAVGMFTVFAFSKTKLFYYLIPIYPFLAIAIAGAGIRLLEKTVDSASRLALSFVGGLLLCIGLISTLYVGFHIDDRMGIMELAKEEAQLGKVLAPLKTDEPVFAVDHLFWETMNFYGHTKIESPPETWPASFFLIVPTYRLGDIKNTLPKKANVSYQGPMLSLIAVEK